MREERPIWQRTRTELFRDLDCTEHGLTAQEAAALYGWQTVPCLDGAGNLRSIDEIHQAIWQAAEPLLYGKER